MDEVFTQNLNLKITYADLTKKISLTIFNPFKVKRVNDFNSIEVALGLL
jgi:hypothetical protein